MTLLVVLAAAALAGDPCPIDLRMAEYTPEWRDRAADLAGLQSQRRWLGLTYKDVGDAVRVVATVPMSPAAAALQEGDEVVGFNGRPVRDRAHLSELFDAADPDGAVTLLVRRDGVEQSVTLARGPADPVFLGLVQAAETTACRDVRVIALTDEQNAAVAKGAFDEHRAFRCDDAHKALGDGFPTGAVVMIRGGHRILLSNPPWNTKCVGVDAYDGERLTDERLRALVDELTDAFVEDRYANP